MLNTLLILKLADFIEAGSMPYDQRHWTQCIAGQCCHMTGKRASYNAGEYAYHLLGIDKMQYEQLFTGAPLLLTPTRGQAVRVLRHLAATGKVNWHVDEKPVSEAPKEAAVLPAALTDTLQAKAPARRSELADA